MTVLRTYQRSIINGTCTIQVKFPGVGNIPVRIVNRFIDVIAREVMIVMLGMAEHGVSILCKKFHWLLYDKIETIPFAFQIGPVCTLANV